MSMLNFNSILIFSEKPKVLAEFYQRVFDSKPVWEGQDYTVWKVGDGYITVGPHDKVHGKNEHPERLMFNLETKEIKEEFERIKELGAHVVKDPYAPEETEGEGQIATFADPDGNFFQLMTPMPMD